MKERKKKEEKKVVAGVRESARRHQRGRLMTRSTFSRNSNGEKLE
jgi:hypothetical protein